MNVTSIFSRYKPQIKDGKIFDPIRQKYVRLTPEEIVRQNTIKYLMKRLGVPQNKIIVERGLATLGVKGSKKRIDIGILDDDGIIIAVVECKASILGVGEAAFLQAQDYLRELNTRYFFVTDGNIMEAYYWDTLQYIRLKEMPKYNRLYYYPTAEEEK